MKWLFVSVPLAFASAMSSRAECYVDGLSMEIRSQFGSGDIEWKTGNAGNGSWKGYGNSNLVFVVSQNHAGYFRTKAPDLRNYTAKFPGDTEAKLKSGGSVIQKIVDGNTLVCGNDRFAVVLGRLGKGELVSFSEHASLSDLCQFTDKLYDEVIYPQIKSAEQIPASYCSLMDLCIEANLLELRVTCQLFVTGMCYGRDYETSEQRESLASVQRESRNIGSGKNSPPHWSLFAASKGSSGASQARIGSVFSKCPDKNVARTELILPDYEMVSVFQECKINRWACECSKGFDWSDETKRVLFEIGVNQLMKFDDEQGCPAFQLGVAVSKCPKSYLAGLLKRIRENTAVDIRKDDYKDADVDLAQCERISDLWNDLNIKEYLGTAANLMKINRVLLILTKDRKHQAGYEEMCLLGEKRRSLMRGQTRQYHYLFSDLIVVVASHKAFLVSKNANGFWNKDRPAVTGVAHQWSRFCADGEACRYLRSHYSANTMEQFHGAVKKILGKDEYETLATTLKISSKREDEEFPSRLP